eukprot:4427341-Pyramimonas_sp.AAC.1
MPPATWPIYPSRAAPLVAPRHDGEAAPIRPRPSGERASGCPGRGPGATGVAQWSWCNRFAVLQCV